MATPLREILCVRFSAFTQARFRRDFGFSDDQLVVRRSDCLFCSLSNRGSSFQCLFRIERKSVKISLAGANSQGIMS